MKALILAAGLGTRLAPITESIPKSLVRVNGEPIIIRQLSSLRDAGIDDITIVAGYLAETLTEVVSDEFPDVRVVVNRDYETTNNMVSAFIGIHAIGAVDDGLIMMNADVFFDSSVIAALRTSCFDNAIVVDAGRYNEESMKVVLESNGRIVGISKAIPRNRAFGCSIDVYKFSAEGVAAFDKACAEYIEDEENLQLWSEVALDDALSEIDFFACPLEGRWLEIDDWDDLRVAQELFAD